MPEEPSPRRPRRAAPPPRDILAGDVRLEELPDVARPAVAAPPQPDAAADPATAAPASQAGGDDPARALLEAGRLPLRLTEATLEGQAQAIEGWISRGALPAALVPGAVVLRSQIQFLLGMVRAASGTDPSE